MADETNEKRPAVTEPPDGRQNGHRRRIGVAFLVMALIAGIVAAYWYFFMRGWVSTDDAYIDCDQITVSGKILGRIVELTLEEGDTIRQDQVVVLLDSTDLKAQEAQAEASLEYIKQNVPVARINLERAEDDFKRAQVQFEGDVIPREQYDHARRAVELTRAQYNAAVSQISAAQAQIGVIQSQLQNTRIISHNAGIVAKKWVVVGDIVQPGQPIYTVYDLSRIWVTANFEETKLESIRIGEPVEIAVDAFPGRKFTGRVELIGAAAASQFSLIPPNNASGNFTKVTQRVPVRISVNAPDPVDSSNRLTLLPGMSVTVRFRDEERM